MSLLRLCERRGTGFMVTQTATPVAELRCLESIFRGREPRQNKR